MHCRLIIQIEPRFTDKRGAVYRQTGAYQLAIAAYQKAIALSGGNEINLAEHLHSIGLVLADQNKSDEAIESFKRALEIRQRILPSSLPPIAKLHNEMGGVFLSKGRCEEALDHFQQARILELESLPENHIETARTLNNIGVTLYKLDRAQEALIFPRLKGGSCEKK
jgi:tetratricopeptide (TPR) repeat protein